jgi:hypothetical protein
MLSLVLVMPKAQRKRTRQGVDHGLETDQMNIDTVALLTKHAAMPQGQYAPAQILQCPSSDIQCSMAAAVSP